MKGAELLRSAGKTYSACAKKVSKSIANAGAPNRGESEQLIAFGIASEWTRRAGALKPLSYEGKLLNRAALTPAVTEMVRFNMGWSALNALFARNEIRQILGARRSGGEFQLFRSLYSRVGLDTSEERRYSSTLNTLLDIKHTTSMPGLASGTEVTTLRALHEKYTPPDYRQRGVGGKVSEIIATGGTSNLVLPELIYLTRNWIVHGAMVPSNFRSVPRFNSFINTTVESLGVIHDRLASELSMAI